MGQPKLSKPVQAITRKSGYHHGDLRNAITDAVSYMIASRRSLDFQLKEVADIVGTSVPALYRHFEGKQALIVETAVEGFNRQKGFRDFALADAVDSPLGRLLAIGYAYVQFARKCPGFFILMKTLETEEIRSSQRYQKHRLETHNLIRSQVEACISQNLMHNHPVGVIMTSLQATAFGLAHIYLTHMLDFMAPDYVGDPELVAQIFELNMGNLLTEKGRIEVKRVSHDPFMSSTYWKDAD